MNILNLIILIGLFIQSGRAQENSLSDDIADGYLDDYSKIEAAFILSGVTNPDSLQSYVNWYNSVLDKVKLFPDEINNPIGSAKRVFLYLHSSWLKTYARESTTLVEIVKTKEYNCVSATILFNLLCEDLMWDNEAFETPTHVYTIFKNFRQKLIVENTSSMGFDIMKNLKEYSKYLARYYPENERLQIGLDRLYYHENSNGRRINNTELLGLLAYNRAYLARKQKDYRAAYDYVLLAQQFNQDSRSNIRFEKGLIFTWGKQLFSQDKHKEAFTVFADGYYRYPQEEPFLRNTLSSFYMSLLANWESKDWQDTSRMYSEIIDLEVKDELDKRYIRNNLDNWLKYFTSQNNQQAFDEVNNFRKLF